MKVLLTGGSGFIGKNFLEKYSGKYDIVAPTFSDMNLTKIVEVNHFFSKTKFDAVVHCAGKGDDESQKLVEADNLIMFKNIQYASIINGVKKLLIAGDVSEFDRSRAIVNIEESEFGKSIPADGYGLGRYLIHLLASKDKISTTLRFFDVFGKYQDVSNSKINEIIARGITGKKAIEIEKDKKFSTIYIDDVVKIISNFLDNDYPRGDYNVINNDTVTYMDIAKTVKKLAKKNGREITINLKTEKQDFECSGSNAKLSAIMPSLKFTSNTGGVTKLFEYLKLHKSECKPKEVKIDG